ncbi:MAG: hypothetical protein WCI73_03710 [Phycisphaerae bacterium]
MARWRAAAIKLLPELREEVAAADNLMALWIELHNQFNTAYREPRNEDLISRIYAYADWCLYAPPQNDSAHDPGMAVNLAFFEHIPTNRAAREDMPRWFTYKEVAACPDIFSYFLDEQAFSDLLAYMKKHQKRYVKRPRVIMGIP